MEPITLGFLLAAALSGIIGNKADQAVDKAVGSSIKWFTNHYQPENQSVYSELQKAISRSFLLAQQSLALECLKELTTGTMSFNYAAISGHEKDVHWLEKKLNQLKNELNQVKQPKAVDFPITFEQIELLFTRDGGLTANSMQAVREKLIAAARAEKTVPYYQAKVEKCLFNKMRHHFASAVLHNPVLNNFFQWQLLTQINANLQESPAQQIDILNWKNSLKELAQNVPHEIEEIKKLLDLIAASLNSPALVPPQFESLIKDKTEGFVGRKFVFDAIEEFLQKQPNGYFIIEADPGVGKSAILAEYVRRTECIAYFNVRSQGITAASEFLKSVCTQLIERYTLPYKELHPDNTRDGNFLARLLDEIVRANHALPLVIAVDALDEVDLKSQTEGANVLYLPASLPNGVYFILTKRPERLPLVVNDEPKIFDLMQYPMESLEDVQIYIRGKIKNSSQLLAWIAEKKLTEEEFVIQLANKSEKNFMYLRYVLPDIERGRYRDLSIESLPKGLEAYYEDHWRRMGMMTKPLPMHKVAIVYFLAQLHEPVSRRMLVNLSGETAVVVQQVLDEWKPFLREVKVKDDKRYIVYHQSFSEFLARQDIVEAYKDELHSKN